jgi:peptidoglycan/LPS O-acetylase OafA/YrhL
MTGWMRRVRGAAGLGLVWAAAWFGAGLALLAVVGPDAADVPFPLGFGALGFVCGVSFGGVLAALGRRRRLRDFSLARFAGWGALGGLLAAVAVIGAAALAGERLELLVLGPVFGVAGAASAAGSLALARGADRRELPPGGER